MDGVTLVIVDCSIAGDVDQSGVVDVDDFLAVLAAWGPCPGQCPPACAEDLDGDCEVEVDDFLLVLAYWTDFLEQNGS